MNSKSTWNLINGLLDVIVVSAPIPPNFKVPLIVAHQIVKYIADEENKK